MNKTKLECSLSDTTELKKLILENQDLPLLIFCGEYCNNGYYGYMQADVNSVSVQELTLYGELWLEKEDYEDMLSNDLCDEEEYENLSDKEYVEMIKQKVSETEFIKAIVVNVDN